MNGSKTALKFCTPNVVQAQRTFDVAGARIYILSHEDGRNAEAIDIAIATGPVHVQSAYIGQHERAQVDIATLCSEAGDIV